MQKFSLLSSSPPSHQEWVSKKLCGAMFLTRIKHWKSATLLTSPERKGISALVPGALPPTSELGFWRVVSHILTPLRLLLCSYFLLKPEVPKVLPPDGRWWFWPWPAAGGSWSWLVLALARYVGSFWHLPREVTPVAPSLPKPCHTNPIEPCSCLCQVCRRETRILWNICNSGHITIRVQPRLVRVNCNLNQDLHHQFFKVTWETIIEKESKKDSCMGTSFHL